MHQDNSIQIFTKLFRKIGKNWKNFIAELKARSDTDDESQIVFGIFKEICEKYNSRHTSKELEQLLESFPGQEGQDQQIRINIARIYDQKYNVILDKMYGKVDVADHEGLDQPTDVMGYVGASKAYRKPVKMTGTMGSQEFIRVFFEDNKLNDIMKTVSSIDKDRNGYVTATELDDILKLFYPDEFETRNIIPIIKKFSSIQNRILVAYKDFREWVSIEVAKLTKAEESRSVAPKSETKSL